MQPTVEMLPVGQVKENPNNSRTHPKKQIRKLAKNIQLFGFTNPLLVDEKSVLLAGHARLAAAKSIGLATVPVLRICGLSEARKTALLFSDNRLGEDARWDRERLAIEGEDAVHGSSGQTFDELAENVSSTPTNARRARGRRS